MTGVGRLGGVAKRTGPAAYAHVHSHTSALPSARVEPPDRLFGGASGPAGGSRAGNWFFPRASAQSSTHTHTHTLGNMAVHEVLDHAEF